MDVQKITAKFPGKEAAALLLTLAAALTLWLFVAAHYRRTATAEIFKNLVAINSHKACEIAAWVRHYKLEAERFSLHPFLGEIISEEISKPGSRRAQLDAWLREYSAQEKSASMAILSPKGAVIAETPYYRAGIEKHFTEAFAQASLKGKADLTDLYLCADGRPRITMLSPISRGGRGGKALCVLVINLDPQTELYPLLKAQPQFFKNIETLLVRVEGEDFLFLNELEHSPGSALKLRRRLLDKGLPQVRALHDIPSGFHDAGTDYRGVKIFRAVSPVEGTNWGVSTNIARDTILAPVKTWERLALALILLAATLLYLAAYFVLRARRLAAGQKLQETATHLRATLDSTADGILAVDREGKVIYTNRRFAELWRIPRPLLERGDDKALLDFVLDQLTDPAAFLSKVQALYASDAEDLDTLVFKDGRFFERFSLPMKTDGSRAGRVWSFRDITGRRRAEAALQESEARYRALVDGCTDGILTADLETRKFKLANRAICRMLGYTAEELTALSLGDIHPKEALPAVIAEFEAQARGAKTLAQDLPCLRKDGTVFYADINTTKILVDGRECNLGMFRDITERRRTQLELENLNRDLIRTKQEMENFLYITTHDLRSPLINIQGFTQNLERHLLELRDSLASADLPPTVKAAVAKIAGERIPEALKYVLEGSNKMDALINALLKVARLGRVEMKPQAVEMNDLVKKVIDSMHFQSNRENVAIKTGALPPCRADLAAVSQIFTNLLGNAIKYKDKDRAPEISVTGEVLGASVRYAVTDNGRGIAARDLPRIWDLFFRAGAPEIQGEGIGLTVVKYMVEKNGGSVRAESKEGQGSVFYLELPSAEGKK